MARPPTPARRANWWLTAHGDAGLLGGQPQRSPYRTGDIVRVLHEGSFDYVGRRDHLVKVRGHRVELGEVEAALTAHPGITEAAVIVRGTEVDARLAAFVVARHGPGPACSRSRNTARSGCRVT